MPVGSTRYIYTNLEDKTESQLPLSSRNKPFAFELAAAHQEELNTLNEKQKLGLELPQGEGLELIDALHKELNHLNQIEEELEKNQDKLLIKKYKLAIIKAFETHLGQLTQETKAQEEKKRDSLLKRFLRRLGYGFLLTFGLIMDGIGSFLGGQELIYLIPGITGPIAMAVGIAFSLINSALFYSFEAGMLKQAMGLDSMDEIGLQLEIDEQEIAHTQKINELMLNQATTRLDKYTYSVYASLAGSINKSVLDKKQFRQDELAEKTSHKILRHIITGVGAIMVSGYSYFMANSLLVFAAPALIGTPAGWIFIALGVATMLAYYLSMRGKAMVNMLNPSMQKFKDIKIQFDQFKPKTEAELNLAYAEKKDKETILHLREDMKALKKENMELKGKLIEKTVKERTAPLPPKLTVLQESYSLWTKDSGSTLAQDDNSLSRGSSLSICSKA